MKNQQNHKMNKLDINIPMFEDFNINAEQNPMERLRNKLNIILGIIDILQSDPIEEIDLNHLKQMSEHIDIDLTMKYLKDVQTIIDGK